MEAPFPEIQETGPDKDQQVFETVVVFPLPCVEHIGMRIIDGPMGQSDPPADVEVFKIQEETLVIALQLFEQISIARKRLQSSISFQIVLEQLLLCFVGEYCKWQK